MSSFNAKTPSADAIFAYATKLAHEVGLVFSSSVSLGGALGQIVKWKHPPEGVLLLNTNGSRRHDDGHASAGEVNPECCRDFDVRVCDQHWSDEQP
ncbi:hypothetical protein PVK06_004119 [Gossypium arboreum]|uniref:Uncharacterized protein n=1 Tax=Gossypium arboreum TaxID=29729 RepID=A0ABR0QR40_GOSAR|nr:hypothetical protein PVK06_004119 [Gossypium arboreum]